MEKSLLVPEQNLQGIFFNSIRALVLPVKFTRA